MPQYDLEKFQKKRMKLEREVYYGDFTTKVTPTPEQIELKKKRADKQVRLDAKKYERSHRGGYSKTKKGSKT